MFIALFLVIYIILHNLSDMELFLFEYLDLNLQI